jgi:hypothetical protein
MAVPFANMAAPRCKKMTIFDKTLIAAYLSTIAQIRVVSIERELNFAQDTTQENAKKCFFLFLQVFESSRSFL